MLGGRKNSSSSFGPDGRRTSGGLPPPRLKCVPRSISGLSSNIGRGGQQQQCKPSMHSTNKLFQPGTKLIIARAPVMAGLSVNGSTGLSRKFQRPMIKRRSYDKNAELALKSSTLGQKRRYDGMAKLMARAGKGLNFKLPERKIKDGNASGTSDESDSDSSVYSSSDDDDHIEDDFIQREIRQQQLMMRQQDEGLEMLGQSAERLSQISMGIHEELGQQNK